MIKFYILNNSYIHDVHNKQYLNCVPITQLLDLLFPGSPLCMTMHIYTKKVIIPRYNDIPKQY